MKQQIGGGNCSLCGSPGVTKATCPLNTDPKAKPNTAKHPNATGVTSATVKVKATVVKATVKPKATAVVKPKADATAKPKIKATVKAKPKAAAATSPKINVTTSTASAEATLERLFHRANKDLLNDLGYPAPGGLYILHFTDNDIDELVTAILDIASVRPTTYKRGYNLMDEIRYIILSVAGSDADVSGPEMQMLKQNILKQLVNKAYKRNENGDMILRSKKEINLELIKDFAFNCFNNYRYKESNFTIKNGIVVDPTNWRLGSACEKLSLIQEIANDKTRLTQEKLNTMPVALVRDSKRYLFDILLTREAIDEINYINKNIDEPDETFIKGFEFRKLSKGDEAFMSKFIPNMLDWVYSDPHIKHSVDLDSGIYSILLRFVIILYSVLELQKIQTPTAKKLLRTLMKFLEENTAYLSCMMVYKMFEVSEFINRQKQKLAV